MAIQPDPFSWSQYDAYCQAMLRQRPLYAALLDSRVLGRLKDVRFLGALDFLKREHWVSTVSPNRFDHSAGVAYLAFRACKTLDIPIAAEQELVVAALLHDVGHGALSHSSERYFKSRFNFSHKDTTRQLIIGDLFVGREISDVIAAFGILPERIVAILSGAYEGPLSHLITCPLNIDTIDGITRTIAFFDPFAKQAPPEKTLAAAVFPSKVTQDVGDAFWRRKHQAYNEYINRPEWAALDDLVTMALSNSHPVSPNDFLLTDSGFYSKFRREIDRQKDQRRNNPLPTRTRTFVVKDEFDLVSIPSLYQRYVEVDQNDEPPKEFPKHSRGSDVYRTEDISFKGRAERSRKQ